MKSKELNLQELLIAKILIEILPEGSLPVSKRSNSLINKHLSNLDMRIRPNTMDMRSRRKHEKNPMTTLKKNR